MGRSYFDRTNNYPKRLERAVWSMWVLMRHGGWDEADDVLQNLIESERYVYKNFWDLDFSDALLLTPKFNAKVTPLKFFTMGDFIDEANNEKLRELGIKSYFQRKVFRQQVRRKHNDFRPRFSEKQYSDLYNVLRETRETIESQSLMDHEETITTIVRNFLNGRLVMGRGLLAAG